MYSNRLSSPWAVPAVLLGWMCQWDIIWVGSLPPKYICHHTLDVETCQNVFVSVVLSPPDEPSDVFLNSLHKLNQNQKLDQFFRPALKPDGFTFTQFNEVTPPYVPSVFIHRKTNIHNNIDERWGNNWSSASHMLSPADRTVWFCRSVCSGHRGDNTSLKRWRWLDWAQVNQTHLLASILQTEPGLAHGPFTATDHLQMKDLVSHVSSVSLTC